MERADLLKARPVQCFRCWKFGHVRFACKEAADRTGHCFRCGKLGHRSSECSAAPHCVICAEVNLPSDHRLGSIKCSAHPDWTGASAPLPSPPLAHGREGQNVNASDRRTEITSMDYD